MDKERALHFAALLTAHANGETLQAKYTNRDDNWDDQAHEVINLSAFATSCLEFRIKPKPVTRPWNKPEDVPKPALYFSNPNLNEHEWMMVIRVDELGIRVGGREDMIPWEEIPNWKWSRDCRAWHRCTVTEESK